MHNKQTTVCYSCPQCGHGVERHVGIISELLASGTEHKRLGAFFVCMTCEWAEEDK